MRLTLNIVLVNETKKNPMKLSFVTLILIQSQIIVQFASIVFCFLFRLNLSSISVFFLSLYCCCCCGRFVLTNISNNIKIEI